MHVEMRKCIACGVMLERALKSSLGRFQFRTSRLLFRFLTLVVLGMTDVPCSKPHASST